jgi:IS5 family transposase
MRSMNLANRPKANQTRPLSENILRCMDPETRKKMGQLTAREAQEKWARETERQMHVDVRRECLRQRIYVIEAPMHKRSNLPKGHPDLTLLKDGHNMLLELKVTTKLSNDQIDCIAELEKCGNPTVVADTLADAINAIHAWLERIGARHST